MHVGEVEGFVAFEEPGVGFEGLAFVVSHVGPFPEVGLCDLSGSRLRGSGLVDDG